MGNLKSSYSREERELFNSRIFGHRFKEWQTGNTAFTPVTTFFEWLKKQGRQHKSHSNGPNVYICKDRPEKESQYFGTLSTRIPDMDQKIKKLTKGKRILLHKITIEPKTQDKMLNCGCGDWFRLNLPPKYIMRNYINTNFYDVTELTRDKRGVVV